MHIHRSLTGPNDAIHYNLQGRIDHNEHQSRRNVNNRLYQKFFDIYFKNDWLIDF
jgi:hypothetical protein